MIDPQELWFNTPDSPTLCRGGSNGPAHPSQLYAIKKYVEPEMNFLDYGCGSATTLEAMLDYWKGQFETGLPIKYLGVDIIPKNIDWCRENFKIPWQVSFEVNPSLHKIDQSDKSFDIVYSRHVVDHMESFEKAMYEMKRVSKNLIITVFWVPMSNQDEHEIKNIDYRPSGGKLYPNEYTNSYSRKKVMEYLKSDSNWELLELAEEIGTHDWIIVLRRKDEA